MTIRIGILGYGNLGKGIECAIKQNDDMELVGVFTRRDPAGIQTASGAPVYEMDEKVYNIANNFGTEAVPTQEEKTC